MTDGASYQTRSTYGKAGDTLRLDAGLVRRTIRGRDLVMYGFNGQYPGPLLHVPEQATITVQFTNHTRWPTAVHWHGVRLDNRFDGVPGVTQEHVLPGETFDYTIFFRDAGIYWYHPHHREDVQQDLGLYGNMLVRPARDDYYSPVHREEVLMLDDVLMAESGLDVDRWAIDLDALTRHHWSGNLRELRNVLERAILLSASDRIAPDDLAFERGLVVESRDPSGSDLTLEQVYQADDLRFTRDPFDALICAAAQSLSLPLLTRDAPIRESGAVRVAITPGSSTRIVSMAAPGLLSPRPAKSS